MCLLHFLSSAEICYGYWNSREFILLCTGQCGDNISCRLFRQRSQFVSLLSRSVADQIKMADTILLLHGRLHQICPYNVGSVNCDGVKGEPVAEVHLEILCVHRYEFGEQGNDPDAEQPCQRNYQHNGKKAYDCRKFRKQPHQYKTSRKQCTKTDHRRPDKRPEKAQTWSGVKLWILQRGYGVELF